MKSIGGIEASHQRREVHFFSSEYCINNLVILHLKYTSEAHNVIETCSENGNLDVGLSKGKP